MSSPWSDLDRPPLSAQRLARALAGATRWQELRLVTSTESTNADVAAAARSGAAEGLVVVAEQQRAGRGRLGRTWESPPRAGLAVSVLLRPKVPAERTRLLPLLAGVALVEAVRSRVELAVTLKWPNDLLAPGGGKLAGILAERPAGDAVVVGVGLNVSLDAAELPDPRATSLRLALGGTAPDREPLLAELLRRLDARYAAWVEADGAPGSVLPDYRAMCATLGRQVRLELPGGEQVQGAATDVADDGALVVDGRSFAAGDVVHLREAG